MVDAVCSMSASARERSSLSEEGSLSMTSNSSRVLCASSHSFSAVVTGPSSPIFFATVIS